MQTIVIKKDNFSVKCLELNNVQCLYSCLNRTQQLKTHMLLTPPSCVGLIPTIVIQKMGA